MITAFNGIHLNDIGVKNADSKLETENTDAASEIFAGMLGCARASRSETINTGYISPTGAKGQSSNKGQATQCSGLSGKSLTTALCEDGLTAERSFPGRAALQTTDNGAAKSKTAHFRMPPDPGAIKPEAASGVQESKQRQAAFGKNGFVKETDNVSGKTVKSDLRKSKSTTSVFGKNETAAKTPTGSEIKLTGNKNSAADLGAADLKQTRSSRQHHAQGITASADAGTPTGSAIKISTDEKVVAGLPDAGLKQPRSFQKHHVAGNTPDNQALNGKPRTTGKHNRGKNDAVTPLKSDEGENPLEIKGRHSNPNGEKIIFEHEKTAARDIFNHAGDPLSKKNSGPVQSIDHELSIGGNQAGPLHNSHLAGMAENTNNSGIDARALISQIAKQARKTGRVRIALTPPRMGKLDMDVVVRDNKVQVILKVENNDVWHALKSNTTSLESALRNQGLMVDTIQVTVQEKFGDNNFGFGQNGAAFKEGSNQENNPGHHQGEPDGTEYGLTGSPEEMTESRMDGRISLFI